MCFQPDIFVQERIVFICLFAYYLLCLFTVYLLSLEYALRDGKDWNALVTPPIFRHSQKSVWRILNKC